MEKFSLVCNPYLYESMKCEGTARTCTVVDGACRQSSATSDTLLESVSAGAESCQHSHGTLVMLVFTALEVQLE